MYVHPDRIIDTIWMQVAKICAIYICTAWPISARSNGTVPLGVGKHRGGKVIVNKTATDMHLRSHSITRTIIGLLRDGGRTLGPGRCVSMGAEEEDQIKVQDRPCYVHRIISDIHQYWPP